MVTYREADEHDLPAIIELATDMVLHSVSPFRPVGAEQVRHYRREDLQSLPEILAMEQSGIFVALDQARVVGHIIVVAHQKDSSTGTPQAWIYDVSVHPGYWGQGVGRHLLELAEQFARQQGMGAIGLGVTLANHRAHRFYLQQGYLEERVQMVKNFEP